MTGNEATLWLRKLLRSPVRVPLRETTVMVLSKAPPGLTPGVLEVFDHPDIALEVPAAVLARGRWRGRHLRDVTALLVRQNRVAVPLEVRDPDATLDALVQGGATMAARADASSHSGREPSLGPLPDELAGRLRASQQRLLWASMASSVLVPLTVLIGGQVVGPQGVALTLALAGLVAAPTAITFVGYRRCVRDVMVTTSNSEAGRVPAQRVEPLVEPIVYRDIRGLRYARIILWIVTIVIALILLGGVIVASDPGPDPPADEFVMIGSIAVFPWIGYLWQRRIRLVADRGGLTMVNAFRTHTMPWSRIKGSFADGGGLTLLLDDGTQVRSLAISARLKDPRAQQFLTLIMDQAAAHTTGVTSTTRERRRTTRS